MIAFVSSGVHVIPQCLQCHLSAAWLHSGLDFLQYSAKFLNLPFTHSPARCDHCKRIAPDYEKAAKILKRHSPPIPIAKVDATVEMELAGMHDVKSYPTFKMFKNGREYPYEGGTDKSGE